jgi:hypothetical protein
MLRQWDKAPDTKPYSRYKNQWSWDQRVFARAVLPQHPEDIVVGPLSLSNTSNGTWVRHYWRALSRDGKVKAKQPVTTPLTWEQKQARLLQDYCSTQLPLLLAAMQRDGLTPQQIV